MTQEQELILFSGGRDSTLVACERLLHGETVVLFTGDSKCALHRELLPLRIAELQGRFDARRFQHVIEDISGTFRSLALENLGQDILRYKKNLILLGEKLAIHLHAIFYCHQHSITHMYDGCVGYQRELPEQRNSAIALLQEFAQQYGITYSCPIYHVQSDKEVKYKLLQLGLSTKSLEGTSIFADTFSTPSDECVDAYLEEKIQVARTILDFFMGRTKKYNDNSCEQKKCAFVG